MADDTREPDEIDLSLDDLDVEPEPPRPTAPAFAPGANTLVIDSDDLLDLTDEPAPAYPGPSDYPAAAAGPGYPAAMPGGYGAPVGKKGPVATLIGSLLLHMLVAGAIGGFLSWAINEPMMDDSLGGEGPGAIIRHVMFFTAIAGGLIGLFLGLVPGVTELNPRKALIGGGISLGIGAVGGAVAGALAQLVYGFLGGTMGGGGFMQILARTIGWSIAGLFIGLSQGAATMSVKKIINGLIGGAIGGFIGGFLFDALGTISATLGADPGLISRLIGLTAIGAATGAAIGIIEELRKEAWLVITGGPLTGKQFILYRPVTSIGSSYKCDIALVKDQYLAPQHCVVEISGGGYTIRDLGTQTGTAVNGRPVQRQNLRNGDSIQIGQTTLTYNDRALR